MKALDSAFAEYVAKRLQPPNLHLDARGYWHPPIDDTCAECAGAQWTSNSGSHLRSLRHIALKHGANLRDLGVLVITHFPPCTIATLGAVLEPEPEPESNLPSVDVAWKAICLTVDSRGERILGSRDGDFCWHPHKVTRAYCAKRPRPGYAGACMGETCSCGLYFFWGVKDAAAYVSSRAVVVRAQIGGTIIECAVGCRAEYAVITGVLNYPNKHFAKVVSRLYGVPVLSPNDVLPAGETLWTT